MKTLKADVLIFSVVLISTFFICLISLGAPPMDIQLHDTYYVIQIYHLLFFVAVILLFLIFLIRGASWKFKSKSTNIGLLISVLLMVYIVTQALYIINLQ